MSGSPSKFLSGEHERLAEPQAGFVAPWRKWGPYVSERSWGSVREDYSPDGCAWEFLTHDMARSKAYRWGEDGIAGICDRYQLLVFALHNETVKRVLHKALAAGCTSIQFLRIALVIREERFAVFGSVQVALS